MAVEGARCDAHALEAFGSSAFTPRAEVHTRAHHCIVPRGATLPSGDARWAVAAASPTKAGTWKRRGGWEQPRQWRYGPELRDSSGPLSKTERRNGSEPVVELPQA